MHQTSSTLEILDPESKLIKECLEKLIKVEIRVNKELGNNDLREDLLILKRNLNIAGE